MSILLSCSRFETIADLEGSLFEFVTELMGYADRNRHHFTVSYKVGRDGKSQERYTDVDVHCEKLARRYLAKYYPDVGTIGEEGTQKPCSIAGHEVVALIDPQDGTDAYIRKQAHGFGFMFAIVYDGTVILSVLGDIVSGDIYYFYEGMHGVCQRTRHGETIDLSYQHPELKGTRCAVRRELHELGPWSEYLLRQSVYGGIVGGLESSGEGIWATAVRLLTGQCAFAALHPALETPWDRIPPMSMLSQFGFVFFTADEKTKTMHPTDSSSHPIMTQREQTVFVIHESVVAEFLAYAKKSRVGEPWQDYGV